MCRSCCEKSRQYKLHVYGSISYMYTAAFIVLNSYGKQQLVSDGIARGRKHLTSGTQPQLHVHVACQFPSPRQIAHSSCSY